MIKQLTDEQFSFLLAHSAMVWREYGINSRTSGDRNDSLDDIKNRYWPNFNWGNARVYFLWDENLHYTAYEGHSGAVIIVCRADPGNNSIRVASLSILEFMGEKPASETADKIDQTMYGIGALRNKEWRMSDGPSPDLKVFLEEAIPNVGDYILSLDSKAGHQPLYKCRKFGRWSKLEG